MLPNFSEEIALLQTVIAGLVVGGGGEIRIPRWAIEEPPEIEIDDDPGTGDWIYRLSEEGEASV